MKRWYKLAALVAGVATLAGAGASARVADAAPKRERADPGRHRLLADGRSAPVRRGVSARAAAGHWTTRPAAPAQVNGRKIEFTLVDDGTDAAKAVCRGQGPDRQGVQDDRRKRLLGRSRSRSLRSPTRTRSSSSPAQQQPMRSRDQQVHVPLGPPEYQDVQASSRVPGGGGRQERRRLRAGHRLRPGQRRRRSEQSSGNSRRSEGGQRARAGSRRRTSRRYAQRSSRRTPTSSSSPGQGRRHAAMWSALDQQGVFDVGRHRGHGPLQRVTWPIVRPGRSGRSSSSPLQRERRRGTP